MYDPLGLSIGTANLVAACSGSPPISRSAVLTLYPHCAPKVGLPGENPNLIEAGTLMSGFVERIGDSLALVSPDGSAHDPDLLMIEALDAMVVAVGADASSSEISIAIPSYWNSATVKALRDGLRTHVGFVRSGMAPHLIPDSIAALTAVNSELEIPAGGVVGLLDFGAAGTSITLLMTQSGFEPVSETLRCEDFSGNVIDRALLLHVLEEIGESSDMDPASTPALGQLSRLKEQCREAKERLSTEVVTELAAELPGRSPRVQVTREQLENLIRDRLTGFICTFEDMIVRNNSNFANLAAVVLVGGGASIPLVWQCLSSHTHRPVLMARQPVFSSAMGALLLASRSAPLHFRTRAPKAMMAAADSVMELPRSDVMVIDQDALTDRKLAWSQTEYPGDVPVRFEGDSYNEDGPSWTMRLNMIEPPKDPSWRRIRLSQLLIGLCAVVAMTAIGGVVFTLTTIERHQAPAVPTFLPVPAPSRALVPSSPASSAVVPSPTAAPLPSAAPVPTSKAPPPPPPPPPPPSVVTTTPPPVRTTTSPPRATTTTTTPPSTTTFSSATPTEEAEPAPSSSPTVSMKTEWLHVPLLPVPIPVPIPVNQAPQRPPVQTQVPQNPFLTPDTP